MGPEKLAFLLKGLSLFQPASIKLKVNADRERTLANIQLIRDAFGKEVPIRFDVNGGWTLEEAAAQIPIFLDNGVNSFEQPLAPKNITGHSELTRLFGKDASIMADETLLSYAIAEELIRQKAFNHFNLKISKLGGILTAYRIFQLAKEFNIPCQLGAHFGETSILSSAGILLTALCDNRFSANEGALGDFLLKEDLTNQPVKHNLSGILKTKDFFSEPGLTKGLNSEKLLEYSSRGNG